MPPPAGASLLRRLAAMVYEGLVVAAILLIAGFPFAGASIGRLEGLTRHLFQAYLFLVLGLYFVWCWRRGGQTLPMKAWKLRVVDARGRPLETSRAILRYALAALALGSSAVAAMMASERRTSNSLTIRPARSATVRSTGSSRNGASNCDVRLVAVLPANNSARVITE